MRLSASRFIGGLAWFLATVLGLGTLWVASRAARSEVRSVEPAVPRPVAS